MATPGCVIGIDPGERWMGVARAAAGGDLALPLGTVDLSSCDDAGLSQLRVWLGGDAPSGVVVGVPVRPDGSEDAQAEQFREFGEWIAAALGAPCHAQNERRTSDIVDGHELARPASGGKARRRGARSRNRRKREREQSHALSAARILQRWLDARGAGAA